jgi:hypothetical protein
MCPLNVRALLFEETIKDNPSALKKWEEEIDSMAKTMHNYKTIVPLIVRQAEVPKTYEVVSGERRRQAATKAGLQVLPCIIREISDDEAIELIAIEDEHRWALNFFEKGKLYSWLKDGKDPNEFDVKRISNLPQKGEWGAKKTGKMSFKEIADMLGRTEQYVKERYYIAKGIPEALAPYCIEKKTDDKEANKKLFTASKAYQLATTLDFFGKPLPNTVKVGIASRITNEGWTVEEIRNSIDKYIGVQKIITEDIKRESLAREMKDTYLSIDARDVPFIMEKKTTLESFKEDKDIGLHKLIGEHPFDILEDLRKKQESIILGIQERGGIVNVVENSNNLNEDQISSTWKVNLNWELTLKEPEEVQSLAEFPEERFASFKEADKWADNHEGFAMENTPMEKAGKRYWRLMIKKSTLSEEEKQQLYGEQVES